MTNLNLREANSLFRQTDPISDLRWALLAFVALVAIDVVALYDLGPFVR